LFLIMTSLREKRPHMLGRVEAVAGDITEDRLGLSTQDEE
jgi:hypothetical protein